MEIKVLKNILSTNDRLAEENKAYFKRNSIKVFNIMASPGAGKTSLLLKVIDTLKDKAPVYVIEGDTASSLDAARVSATGTDVIQINTGNECHLDAGMIGSCLPELGVKPGSVVFIENVGNLICPSEFDLGEDYRIVVASVPEGDDKPYKYLMMYRTADVIVLNKTDLLPYVDFNLKYFYDGIRALNEKAPVFEISCKTGAGYDDLADWFIKTL